MPDLPSFGHNRSTTITGVLKPFDTLGRFELRKVLGKGAQSTVWLAFDPRLERDVALKVMHLEKDSDDNAVAQWLQEARSVGRVKHPHIVPVYEADIQDRQPYLVFEYVVGTALDQVIRQRGALPAPEAVAVMMDVLDAVSVAHAAGVVHRDIKPSNILMDTAGHARVMDFGIAARIQASKPGGTAAVVSGTAGYLSPEAASGAVPAASMDIFSAGVVLAELLIGKPLIDERDAYRAIYRVAHSQLTLPAHMPSAVDDTLRAIVMRALARDPAQRFASAREFFAALDQWGKPAAAADEAASADTTVNSSTLEFLLRRMRHKSDFPALSDSVIRIQRMANSDSESVTSVTNQILKDIALTNKLLRFVNSAHFARGGNVSTVSRAVTLVGFNGIRNLALSLVLLEHMQDKTHAAQLKDEFLRSLAAGVIGGELCPVQSESEEAFIGAMFQELGRLLVQFYFPEEARQIRKLMQLPKDPLTEMTAAINVLGLNFEALGLGVAKAWGLPVGIQRCMRKPRETPPLRAPSEASERIGWIALAANEIADVLLHSAPAEVDFRVSVVAKKYGGAMGVGAKEVQAATAKARQKLVELASVMEIKVAPGSAAAKLLTVPDLTGPNDHGTDSGFTENLGQFELHATQTGTEAHSNERAPQRDVVADILAAGIQDITNAMVEDFKLTDVLRMILETMYRALEFDRIIFCMRDAKTDTVTGRFGLGLQVEQYVKTFKVPLKAATPDLFAVVCNKGADTLISDASETRIVQRLPDWYRKGINAPTFLLLPLHIKGAPFGLIYADKGTGGALELDEKSLSLLRTLRNQAVMAFKQSS
jgi:serine/threonine protein kinase